VTDFLSTNLLATGRKVPVLSLKQRTIETRPVRHSQKSSNIDWWAIDDGYTGSHSL